MSHLDALNPAQREAVLSTEGPLLVLAGAGAGKTRVIAHRILEIVKRGTAPSRILAITFTNKAAKEMRERVEKLLRESPELSRPAYEPEELPFVSTFHSLGLRIIKENYRELGFKRFPVVYDRSDSLRAMKNALKELGLEEELEARLALGGVSRMKGDGITALELTDKAETQRESAMAAAWRAYERALAADQALDFDDLLVRALGFLKENGEARLRYQKRWPYIHIDEYQDTNRAQASLVSLLVGPEMHLCAVGDVDQTIYTWRGAKIQNIMTFEKQFEGARRVLLEENYRSTKNILEAANDLISKNQYRMDKNLFTQNGVGEKLSLYQAFDETDESLFVARKIRELMEANTSGTAGSSPDASEAFRGAKPRDIAILYRANFQSRALEEALLAAAIPYQVLGTRFFERAEVKDAVSFIRAALYGASADIARVANVPKRGIGKATLLSMLAGSEESLPSATREKVRAFRDILARIKEAAERFVPSEVLRFALEASGMEREYKDDKIEGPERLENLRELVSLASRYDSMGAGEGLMAFLENAALASDQDEMKDESDAVRLMTVHASKGLEFPHVFITGLEQGLFPSQRENEKKEDDEEERRLMYVALTRAQRKIFLTYASMRTIFGSQTFNEPSQFIGDIPEDLIENEAPERLGKTIYLE